MSAPVLSIQTHDLETEKPPGGKGQEQLYIVEVLLDGAVALHLQAYHFKKPGQMAGFVEAMRAVIAGGAR